MSEPDETAQAQPIEPPSGRMSVDRQSIEGIFIEALGKAVPEERRAFLDTACASPEIRQRVEALLTAHEDAGSFLQQPAGDWRHPPGAGPVDAHGIPADLLKPSDKPGCLGTLGTYEVQEVLGRGGMGIVLRALDPTLNRVVAIKVLGSELARDPASRRRFLREARAAAAVSHPHVVTIHAVDEETPHLVMECIVGRSLQQKLDQTGPLKLTEILRIGTQIAEGLAAAHKHGLVHRDIKPANILLENGVERVKITDFGLARSVEDVRLTRTGEVSGTPQFMSPEQALGQRVDHRSDLFSLGCVLYAMCTGRPPFRGNNVAVVVKRICDEPPRPIAEINPEIPHWLVATVERLLAKDPEQRFQTADEVAQVLSGQLAHAQLPQAGSAAPPPVPAPRRAPVPQPNHDATRAAAQRPWKIAGWMVVAVLAGVLLIPVLIVLAVIGVAIPAYQASQSSAEMGHLTVVWDKAAPVMELKVFEGDSVRSTYPTPYLPFSTRLLPGRYALEAVYEYDGHKGSVQMPFAVHRQKETRIDLAPLIETDMKQAGRQLGSPSTLHTD